MRWALVVVLGCHPDIYPQEDVETIESLTLAPSKHEYVEVDYVAGGGAAGYTGLRITVLRPGHAPAELGLVHESSHPRVSWPNDKLELDGCFEDFDLGNLRRNEIAFTIRNHCRD